MQITFYPAVDLIIAGRNAEFARSLNLPKTEDIHDRAVPLAVVGGGLSLADHLDELRTWPGEIWAINETWRYLSDHGIDATFYSIHPRARVADMLRGAKNCILPLQSAPETLCAALAQGSEILTVDAMAIEGSSSAPKAVHIALPMGYESVTFFGIDCCFQFERSHVSVNHPQPQGLVCRCNGYDFLTNPQLYLQAQEIASLVVELPLRVRSQSEGLADAMILCPKHELTHSAPTINDTNDLIAPDVAPLMTVTANTGNPGWGDDGAADAAVQRLCRVCGSEFNCEHRAAAE